MKREVVVYTCDRCGDAFDPPAKPTNDAPGVAVVIHVRAIYRAGSLRDATPQDLCGPCSDMLRRFLAGGVVSLQNQIRINPLEVHVDPPVGTGGALGSVGRALLEAQLRNRMR